MKAIIKQSEKIFNFQVAHYVTPFNYDSLDSVHKALNGLLPPDIRIREVSPALPEFHARFSVTSKIYRYKIFNDTIMDPLQRHYTYHSVYKLNADIMRDAAKHFIGKHDFSAFCNSSRNDRIPDPVKIIFRFDIIEMVHINQHFFFQIDEFKLWEWATHLDRSCILILITYCWFHPKNCRQTNLICL